MVLPTGIHIQMHFLDDQNNTINVLPIVVAKDTAIDNSQNENIDNQITSLQELIDALGALAFTSEIPAASTSGAGLVQLSSAIDSSSSSTAATSAAVKEVNESAVHNTEDEDIEGVKNFIDGIAISDGVEITSETDSTTGDVTTTISFLHPEEPEPEP